MNKYDNMVTSVKKKSAEKVKIAKDAILYMLENNQHITVCGLVELTGLSRGFFYNNQEVKEILNRALDSQPGNDCMDRRSAIIDAAMSKQLETLGIQCARLKEENKKLQTEIVVLRGREF
ncbi:MAG: hypothetical protein GX663_02865 [Clostridiales bacterium]|nr:hypothetical protein [Clostridiales bacterium]